MKPCKHLDYSEGKFVDCELVDISHHFPNVSGGVRYWARGERWLEGLGGARNAKNVQFCGAGRGRINGIAQCYNGEMYCYEAEAETAEKPEGGAG